jgi:fused signal recognition particle receptor
MSWFSRLKSGLTKTTTTITEGITKVFTHKTLDQDALDELEESLIRADVGVAASSEIIAALSKDKFNKQASEEEIKEFLSDKIQSILVATAKPLEKNQNLQVILVCGVNGNGKTTTIGKLASKYQAQGKKVLMAACDTFRAAAMDQLKVWSERVGCEIVVGAENSDPASVAFKAMEKARAEGVDILLIDTAGRLHNKANLMEELAKIIRVIKKIDETAPHDTVLVLDATTGQNALIQVETFKEIVNISGLILTKLDGTAKGGIIVAIAKKFNMPIHYIGVGETIEDLDAFSPRDFARALLGMS